MRRYRWAHGHLKRLPASRAKLELADELRELDLSGRREREVRGQREVRASASRVFGPGPRM
jgi:hypothetical protein